VIDGWLKDFFAIATTMQQLDTSNGDFLNELKEHFQMQCLLALVSELMDNTEGKCMEYHQTFLQHSYLGTDSIDDSFKGFLEKHAQDLVSGFSEGGVNFVDIMKLIGVDMGKRIPSVQKFDELILKFTQMKSQIAGLKTPVDIHLLRLNAQPVKVHLVQCAARWGEKYSMFLHEWTSARIQSTAAFINKVSEGLKQSPAAAGREASEQLLYQKMTHIRDVKLAMNAIKRLFDPLRERVQLLKKHGVAVSDHEVLLLEQMPAKWGEIVRAAFDEKERILPLQNAEMLKIKKKIDELSNEIDQFRAEFLAECPFQSGPNLLAQTQMRSLLSMNDLLLLQLCKLGRIGLDYLGKLRFALLNGLRLQSDCLRIEACECGEAAE
jgi:dynein heavy chain